MYMVRNHSFKSIEVMEGMTSFVGLGATIVTIPSTRFLRLIGQFSRISLRSKSGLPSANGNAENASALPGFCQRSLGICCPE